jgi:hypothetical protein
MSRSFELSGRSLVYVFYAVSVAALVPPLVSRVLPLDTAAGVGASVSVFLLSFAAVVGLNRVARRWDGAAFEPYDVRYDPLAYPGQAARRGWERAIRRLSGGDDEED